MDECILIVEDNQYLREFMKSSLRDSYTLHEAGSGKQALQIMKSEPLHMILLDLKLGDMDGSDILTLLRMQDISIPIIVITSVNDLETRLDLFSRGCDDYITKPFHKEELLARIQRMFTRLGPSNASIPVQEEIQEAPFSINFLQQKAYKNSTPLELGTRLFNIFSYFLMHKDQIITKKQLHMNFWDPTGEINDNTISVHIHMLRKEIEDDPANPVYLKTVVGSGFIFSVPD